MKLEDIKKLNANDLIALQDRIYSQKLTLTDTVPAKSSKKGVVNVSTYGHFLMEKMTGTYETLYLSSAPSTYRDDGKCYLFGKLIDNSTNRELFDNYTPFSLFLTPGRMVSLGSNLDPAQTITYPTGLFFPDEFIYLFPVNTDIALDVRNESTADLKYWITFHGYRLC